MHASAQLTVAVGVWLRPRLFPAPSVYVHADAPPHSVRSTRLSLARDRIAAIDLMPEHGMRGNISVNDVRVAVIQMLNVIEELVESELAAELIRRIRATWRMSG